jgi:hypothetical protein
MKTLLRFSTVVLVGLLTLAACAQMRGPHAVPRPAGPLPGGPNDPVPEAYLRGTDFDKPTMIRYSWGIIDSPPLGSGGPQISYTWAEIRRRLAAGKP